MSKKDPVQTLVKPSIFGTLKMTAPSGWEFDRTAMECWYWLINHRETLRTKQFKRKYERAALEAKCEMLAQVIANCLGMAGTYWLQEADNHVVLKDKSR